MTKLMTSCIIIEYTQCLNAKDYSSNDFGYLNIIKKYIIVETAWDISKYTLIIWY